VSEPFRAEGGVVEVRLSSAERDAISGIPEIIEAAGAADGRFEYQAHPEDAAADRRYHELIGDDLDKLRSADREAFRGAIQAESLEPEQAEAMMRVIGEARIVLAQRLGFEEDGWEETALIEDPEVAMLHYLGYLQDALVAVLAV
jgi:hypothetical protein